MRGRLHMTVVGQGPISLISDCIEKWGRRKNLHLALGLSNFHKLGSFTCLSMNLFATKFTLSFAALLSTAPIIAFFPNSSVIFHLQIQANNGIHLQAHLNIVDSGISILGSTTGGVLMNTVKCSTSSTIAGITCAAELPQPITTTFLPLISSFPSTPTSQSSGFAHRFVCQYFPLKFPNPGVVLNLGRSSWPTQWIIMSAIQNCVCLPSFVEQSRVIFHWYESSS